MRLLANVLIALACAAASSPAWADEPCPEGEPAATNDTVTRRLAIAEGDVAIGDVARLNGRVGSVQVAVSCLGEVISPDNAARYHLLRALRADPLGANPTKPEVTFAAGRAYQLGVKTGVKDPQLSLSLPAGHGLAEAFGSAPVAEAVRVRAPRSGSLAFDGVEGRDRPSNAATVFQRIEGSGTVSETRYVLPSEPLPAYPVKPVLRTGLAAAAGVFAVVAASSYAGAIATESKLVTTEDPTLVGPAYALFGGAVGAGVVAIGLGAGALAVGAR